jgi:Protein of unknown function (DUF2947)
MMDKFLSFDNFDGAWYFLGAGSDEPYVPPNDLKLIQPLTEQYSTWLWRKYISSRGHHLMLLHEKDWPCKAPLLHRFFAPTSPVTSDIENQNFVKKLCKYCEYELSEKLIFFWSDSHAVMTTWEVFLRHAPCFFFDDEGCILIIPSSMKSVIISNDCVSIRRRTHRLFIRIVPSVGRWVKAGRVKNSPWLDRLSYERKLSRTLLSEDL